MKVKKKPLHEVVLDILYYEDTEKPVFMLPEDILWKIKDSDVRERHVNEVLEWLVYNKKAVKQFGKYQIDRYEFIERANNDKGKSSRSKKGTDTVKRISVEKAPDSWFVNFRESFSKITFYLLLLSYVGFISVVAYKFYKEIYTPQKPITTDVVKEEIQELKLNNLYFNSSRKVKDSARFSGIKRSFYTQNKINKEVKKRIGLLNSQDESIQKHIFEIQEKMTIKDQKQNQMIAFLLVTNIVLFLLLLFKRF